MPAPTCRSRRRCTPELGGRAGRATPSHHNPHVVSTVRFACSSSRCSCGVGRERGSESESSTKPAALPCEEQRQPDIASNAITLVDERRFLPLLGIGHTVSPFVVSTDLFVLVRSARPARRSGFTARCSSAASRDYRFASGCSPSACRCCFAASSAPVGHARLLLS